LIAEANFGDLHKIRWSRASRTDKGVSALANVSGAKLLIGDQEDMAEVINRVNASLKPDLRLLAIKSVTGSFNAKNLISHREYEYLFPANFVFPNGYTEADHTRLNELASKFTGTHKFHNYSKNMTIHMKTVNRYVINFEIAQRLEESGDHKFLSFRVVG
jgi:tRNA pseudouridine38-40 synthase